MRTQKSPKEFEGLAQDTLLKMYHDMMLVRRFEERCGQAYGMGLIGGFCHLYIGQEAVVVGIQSALKPIDSIITGYRDHGHMLACDMDPKGVMAELMGKATGYSKGKGGSMHMFSREKNFFGGHGIVGAQVSLGTGIAFAHKYQQTGGICVTSFGDGATNQGQVYESYNMASLWKLPVIFVIENNQYGMGTSVARASAGEGLGVRGKAFGIPCMVVDGMDVLAVRSAALKAAEHARSGNGPFILEVLTYRYRGHSMSDPAKYRSRDEVEEMRSRHDPIETFGHKLIEADMANDASLASIDQSIKDVVAEAMEFARTSDEPEPRELYTDVYKDPLS